MAKALKIAAVVVGVTALAFTGIGLAAGLGAAATSFGIGVSASTLFLASAGLAAAGSLLAPRPKAPQSSSATTDRLSVSIDARTPRKFVFGRTAMATDLRDQEYTDNQTYLHRFVVVAAHRVQSIEEIWFDDYVAWTLADGVTASLATYLTVTVVLEGSADNAINISPRMGSSRRYTGCAYVHFRYKLTGASKGVDSPFAQSITNRVTIVGRAARLYDPRRDSSVGGDGGQRAYDQTSWPWDDNACRNPPLALLFYLLGWRIVNPATGEAKLSVAQGIPPARIDFASFITAANLCDEPVEKADGSDEPRYRCDGIFSEGDNPKLVLDALKATMNAVLDDVDGKIRVTVLHNDLATPSAPLTTDDVQGAFRWDQTPPLSETFNVVRGSCTDASSASLYQQIDTPEVRIDSPDGIDRIETVNLPTVQSASQKQRLDKARLRRMQYSGMFSATFLSSGWRYQKNDVVPFTFAPLGWVNKLMRIADLTVQVDGLVPMVLREENVAIYADDLTELAPIAGVAPTTYDAGLDPIRRRLALLTNAVERGPYDPLVTYVEGNVVSLADGSRWLFVDETPTVGAVPSEDSISWSLLQGTLTLIPDSTLIGGTIDPETGATQGGVPAGDIAGAIVGAPIKTAGQDYSTPAGIGVGSSELTRIGNLGILKSTVKPSVKAEFERLGVEITALIAFVAPFAGSVDLVNNLQVRYADLTAYLVDIGAFDDMDADTAIVAGDWLAAWTPVYTDLKALYDFKGRPADSIPEITRQNVLQVLLPRLQTQGALKDKLFALAAASGAQAGSTIDNAAAAVNAAITASAPIVTPILDNPDGWASVDYAALNDALLAIDAALAALDALLKFGAPSGSLVGGVPVAQVVDVVDKFTAQQKTDAELVANGSLSPAEKAAIYDQVHFLYGGLLSSLVGLGQKLNIDGEAAQDSFEALEAFLLNLPNWASTTLSSPVDPAEYLAVRDTFFAVRNALDAEIKRVQGGLQSTDPIYDVAGGALLAGNRIKGAGVWYSLNGYAGGAHLKMLALAGTVAWGLVEDPEADGPEDISWGYRFEAGTLTAIKNGVTIATQGTGLTPPVQGQVDYFDGGSSSDSATVHFQSPQGALLPSQIAVNGKTYFAKAFLLSADAEMQFQGFVGEVVAPYSAIPGKKPPVNATAGANQVAGVEASGATGPDAAGYFGFAGTNAKLFLVGNETARVSWTGEPYAKITIDLKDDTGVGDAIVAMIFDTVASGAIARSVNARAGGTVAVPIGATGYYAVQSVSFSSGSIKMKKAVIVGVQDAGTAGGGGAPQDAGIDITTFFQMKPSAATAAAFGQYGMYPPGGSDNGQLDFRDGDQLAYFIEATGSPDGYSRTLGAKWLYLLRPGTTNPGNAVGSVIMTVYGATSTAGAGATSLGSFDLTEPGEDWVAIDGYSHFRIEVVSAVSSGFFRIGYTAIAMRSSKVTAQDVVDAIAPANNPANYADAGPGFYVSYTPRGFNPSAGYTIVETKSLYAIGFTTADPAATVDVTTSVEWGTILLPPDFPQGRSGVGQGVLVDGVQWSRSWQPQYGSMNWLNYASGPAGTPEFAGWVKAYSQAAPPATTDIISAETGDPLSDVQLLNEAIAMTADGLLVGASPASQPIDATLLLNGPVEANADSTINNIPFGYYPSFQIGGNIVTTDSPFLIYQPRFKGATNISSQASWTANITQGLTGTIDNVPGSTTRGIVRLTLVKAMLGFVVTTSTDDGGVPFTIVSRVEKSYPRSTYGTDPASVRVGLGSGSQTTARIINSTAWTVVTADFYFNIWTSSGQTGISLSFQATGISDVQGVADNSCTIDYKLQRLTGGIWSDVIGLGTSTALSDYRDDDGYHLAVANLNYRDLVYTTGTSPEMFRIVARLSNATSSVTIKSVAATAFDTAPLRPAEEII